METFIQHLNLNEEQRAIFEMTDKFLTDKIDPGREKNDLYPLNPFVSQELSELASLGLLRFTLPVNLGGSNLLLSDLNVALFATSSHCPSMATLLLSNNLAWDTLALYTKQEELLALVESTGDETLISYPLFYHADFTRSAFLSLDKGKVNGKINSMTLAPVSDFVLVPVSQKGVSTLYLFPTKAKGLSVSSPLFMHGLRQCPFADISFENVNISDALVLGDAGETSFILQKQNYKFSGSALAIFAGLAAGSFLSAKKYMLEREQGGSLLIEKSVLQLMLSSLKSSALNSLQSSIFLTYHINENLSAGDVIFSSVIRAKKELSKIAHYGIQLLGGYGYMRDYNQEKYFRDAISLKQIFGRVEEMELSLVSKYVASENQSTRGIA